MIITPHNYKKIAKNLRKDRHSRFKPLMIKRIFRLGEAEKEAKKIEQEKEDKARRVQSLNFHASYRKRKEIKAFEKSLLEDQIKHGIIKRPPRYLNPRDKKSGRFVSPNSKKT